MSMAARVSLAVLLAVLLALQHRLWLSPHGLREVFRLRGEAAAQRAENAELERRNGQLVAEVEDLREGLDAIEERARADLGMIRDGETFYRTAARQRELSESRSP
jgi:cell division protein FtsB